MRIVGLGSLKLIKGRVPALERDHYEFTLSKEGADYFDHDLLNKADTYKQIKAIAPKLSKDSNAYVCRIYFKGRKVDSFYIEA